MASNAENISIWWRHHGVRAEIRAMDAFEKGQNASYAKPLMEFLMAKFNLPADRKIVECIEYS